MASAPVSPFGAASGWTRLVCGEPQPRKLSFSNPASPAKPSAPAKTSGSPSWLPQCGPSGRRHGGGWTAVRTEDSIDELTRHSSDGASITEPHADLSAASLPPDHRRPPPVLDSSSEDDEAPPGPATEPGEDGAFVFANGDRYEGAHVDGKRHGHGVYYFADGDRYEGQYVDDMYHGWGVFTGADGSCFAGEYRRDMKHGAGTYSYPDGRAEVGTYADDDDSGEGARWDADRTRAWRLADGEIDGDRISLEEAAAIAARLGLSVPPPAPTDDASARYDDESYSDDDRDGSAASDSLRRDAPPPDLDVAAVREALAEARVGEPTADAPQRV